MKWFDVVNEALAIVLCILIVCGIVDMMLRYHGLIK